MSNAAAQMTSTTRPLNGRPRSSWVIASAFVLIVFVRLLVIRRIGLFNDEAYYWEWSRRLGLSYFDHPPLVAYLIAASTKVFGTTVFAVHLPATVLSLFSSIVLWLLVLKLFPGCRQLAGATALVFNCVPLLSVGAIFTTPDAPCVFFWLLSAYLVRMALEKSEVWYLVGASCGLGMLSKYNFALFPPAVFLYLSTSSHRHWLRRKEPYLAAAFMLVLFSPVVIWNVENHGASFLFHLVERHQRSFTPLLNIGRFLVAQLSLSPLLFLACLFGWWHSFKKGRHGDDAHWYLVCISSLILIFFASLSTVTLINPNWFAVGYVTLLVSAVEWLSTIRSRLFQIVTVVGLAVGMSALFYLQALFLILPLPMSSRDEFTLDLHGWKEVGRTLQILRHTMPQPDRVFVFTRRFQFSALAAFYGGKDLDVTRLGGRRDQYDYWRSDEHLRGKDAIFFSNDRHFFNPTSEYPFQRCEKATEWDQFHQGQKIRTFYFWRCYGYAPPPA